MNASAATRAGIELELSGHGLRLRGGFVPDADDALPLSTGGRSLVVVWMVGQVGSSCWKAFSGSPYPTDGQPNPLDRWARSIGNVLAARHDGLVLMPSDGPPYRPFARWAERAEPLARSPIGLQIHPTAGLWHAYRFALALPDLAPADAAGIARAGSLPRPDFCARCAGQPCLSGCPVGAFSTQRYDVPGCAAHLHSAAGAACMARGCLARHACPVGSDHVYEPAQAAFHMAHFAMKHRPINLR